MHFVKAHTKLLYPKLTTVLYRTLGGKQEHKKVVKGIVLGLYQKDSDNDPKFTPTAEKFDDRVQGKLTTLIKETNITGCLGSGKVFQNVDNDFRSVAIIGLGREGVCFNSSENIEEGMEYVVKISTKLTKKEHSANIHQYSYCMSTYLQENVRVAAGIGARHLQYYGCTEVHVESMEYPEQAAEGSAISIFRYQDNKRKQDKMIIPCLELYESPDIDAWTRGLFKAEAQNLARRLADSPANMLTPTTFAQAAVDALCPCGVTVEVRTINWIEANHLNSFLTIAKGSCEPPIFLEISYCGTVPEDKPVLLVGSGLTFDSGGLGLRRTEHMDVYRASMSGAGVVVATIRAAAALSLPINIAAVIPLCENVASGLCVRPGDVITLLNSKTLAINDTSRAGVVAIADPLIYGQNTYKPKLVVDVATLDKGVRHAFGGAACGVFSNSDYIWKEMYKAGAITGDRVWRMPLWKYYRDLVTDNVAFDINNIGLGEATSCQGAAILHQCVPCIDWIHLDITNVGMITRTGSIPYLLPNRTTGRPTRTLIQFLNQIACPEGNN